MPTPKTPIVTGPVLYARLLVAVTDHVATLECTGFGGEGEINGADAVDAVNAHFEALRDALYACRRYEGIRP